MTAVFYDVDGEAITALTVDIDKLLATFRDVIVEDRIFAAVSADGDRVIYLEREPKRSVRIRRASIVPDTLRAMVEGA